METNEDVKKNIQCLITYGYLLLRTVIYYMALRV